MVKKIVLMIMCLCFILSACGGDKDTPVDYQPPQNTYVTPQSHIIKYWVWSLDLIASVVYTDTDGISGEIVSLPWERELTVYYEPNSPIYLAVGNIGGSLPYLNETKSGIMAIYIDGNVSIMKTHDFDEDPNTCILKTFL